MEPQNEPAMCIYTMSSLGCEIHLRISSRGNELVMRHWIPEGGKQ